MALKPVYTTIQADDPADAYRPVCLVVRISVGIRT
jgi:hypothetical protein